MISDSVRIFLVKTRYLYSREWRCRPCGVVCRRCSKKCETYTLGYKLHAWGAQKWNCTRGIGKRHVSPEWSEHVYEQIEPRNAWGPQQGESLRAGGAGEGRRRRKERRKGRRERKRPTTRCLSHDRRAHFSQRFDCYPRECGFPCAWRRCPDSCSKPLAFDLFIFMSAIMFRVWHLSVWPCMYMPVGIYIYSYVCTSVYACRYCFWILQ